MEDERNIMRIAITAPEIRSDEADIICRLIDSGWHKVHLRHPGASLRDMRSLIEAVPQKYHSHLRLHGHFALTNEFNLGGLHLNLRCPYVPDNYTGPTSISCHDINEISLHTDCDYVTLSPIFDSISKVGYKRAFDDADLRRLDNLASPPVIALGGINPDNVKPLLSNYNFAGYAVLGAIMNSSDYAYAIERFNKINFK